MPDLFRIHGSAGDRPSTAVADADHQVGVPHASDALLDRLRRRRPPGDNGLRVGPRIEHARFSEFDHPIVFAPNWHRSAVERGGHAKSTVWVTP